MTLYNNGSFIFPPRPEDVAPPSTLSFLGSRDMWAQAKLNGSCATLATDGTHTIFRNRYGEAFARELIPSEQLKMMHIGPQGTWSYLCGEYMNKSQRNSKGEIFNGKFVIFDVLVISNNNLIGTTLEERFKILESKLKLESYDDFIYKTDKPNCYLVKNILKDQEKRWHEVIKTEMYEGFVFKQPDVKLTHGSVIKNNTQWQTKVRKPTKNYKY